MDEKVITFQLKGDEIARFERAFELSGLRSRSEFVRFILNAEIPKYYGEQV